jgi:hypothetical protein
MKWSFFHREYYLLCIFQGVRLPTCSTERLEIMRDFERPRETWDHARLWEITRDFERPRETWDHAGDHARLEITRDFERPGETLRDHLRLWETNDAPWLERDHRGGVWIPKRAVTLAQSQARRLVCISDVKYVWASVTALCLYFGCKVCLFYER